MPKKTQIKKEVPKGSWSFSSLDEWRTRSDRLEWTRNLLSDPEFREFLGMLWYEATRRKGMNVDPTTVSVEFGRGEGRRDVLDWIEMAAQPQNQQTEPSADYGIPDEPEDVLE